MTDYRVSQDTGIATSTLTEWKKGAYTPKLDKLLLIAKLFHVSIEELIGEGVTG
jgi:transcriptional regulator with XRE-family HTH domain